MIKPVIDKDHGLNVKKIPTKLWNILTKLLFKYSFYTFQMAIKMSEQDLTLRAARIPALSWLTLAPASSMCSKQRSPNHTELSTALPGHLRLSASPSPAPLTNTAAAPCPGQSSVLQDRAQSYREAGNLNWNSHVIYLLILKTTTTARKANHRTTNNPTLLHIPGVLFSD